MDIRDNRRNAKRILEKYKGEVDDYFKLWPPDKQYFFSQDNEAFIAYSVKNGIAVCIGDPAGKKSSVQTLLREFNIYCRKNDRKMLFIQTTEKYCNYYNNLGLRKLLIGADAVIDIDKFLSHTVHNKYFRNIVNRFEKNGFIVTSHTPPHSTKLLKELRIISNSWLGLPHRKDWSFLTGSFDDIYLQQVGIAVLRDNKGVAQAFINELPSYKQGTSTIDLMRHRQDAPANSMDYLFIIWMKQLGKERIKKFSLGLSPLDSHPLYSEYSARILMLIYKMSNSFIGFKGLHQFKGKYEPEWEPRYVWYSGKPMQLIGMGRALFSLMIKTK